MAIDKRWQQTFNRLDAIEETIRPIAEAVDLGVLKVDLEVLKAERQQLQELVDKAAKYESVTKEQLTEIKGVGDATADEILKLING